MKKWLAIVGDGAHGPAQEERKLILSAAVDMQAGAQSNCSQGKTAPLGLSKWLYRLSGW